METLLRKLGLALNDENECLVMAALEWLRDNTRLGVELTDESIAVLPASAVLFISKFVEIAGREAGVTGESIAGMSQSFDVNVDLRNIARTLLGTSMMKSCVSIFQAQRKWV